MTTEERQLKPTDRIYDLVDAVEEGSSSAAKDDEGIIVIDGRVYERILTSRDQVYDLVDVVDDEPAGPIPRSWMEEEIRKIASEIAEKIAREVTPKIAERVIREEIEKLKQERT